MEPIAHNIVLHSVDQELQVHEGIVHCLDFNLWVGDGRAETEATDAAENLLCTLSYLTW